jgi:acyl-coenzyme A thioesterase PaaI-like protein
MINGGLIAVVIEEAVLSASTGGALDGLTVRYLRPGRVGPFVATAQLSPGLARVEVRDAGAEDRLLIVATGRVGAHD